MSFEGSSNASRWGAVVEEVERSGLTSPSNPAPQTVYTGRWCLAKEYVDSILQGLSGEVSKSGIEKDQRAVSPPAPHIHRRPDRLAGLILFVRIYPPRKNP